MTMNNLNQNTISFQESLARIAKTTINHFEAELKELQYAGGHNVKIGIDTHELTP